MVVASALALAVAVTVAVALILALALCTREDTHPELETEQNSVACSRGYTYA